MKPRFNRRILKNTLKKIRKLKRAKFYSKKSFAFLQKSFIFLILVILLLALFFSAARLLKSNKDQKITASLVGVANEFKISFNIPREKDDDFKKVLTDLNLPQSITDGVNFELDATSSAALSFIAPVNANFNVFNNEIDFQGTINHSPFDNLQISQVRFPKSTNLAIFAPDLREFIKAKIKLPDEFYKWIDDNLNPEQGHYLAFFGPQKDAIIIFKSQNPNLENLSEIKIEGSDDSIYKKERFQDLTDVHFVKLSQDSQRDLTAAVFEMENWIYLILSKESTDEIIKSYLSNDSQFLLEFPSKTVNKKASLVVSYINNDESNAPDKFFTTIIEGGENVFQTLGKIQNFEFTLKADSFSGLIKIK